MKTRAKIEADDDDDGGGGGDDHHVDQSIPKPLTAPIEDEQAEEPVEIVKKKKKKKYVPPPHVPDPLVDREMVIDECLKLMNIVSQPYTQALATQAKLYRAEEKCAHAAYRHPELPLFYIRSVRTMHCVACVQLQQHWWVRNQYYDIQFTMAPSEKRAGMPRNAFFVNTENMKKDVKMKVPAGLKPPPPPRPPTPELPPGGPDESSVPSGHLLAPEVKYARAIEYRSNERKRVCRRITDTLMPAPQQFDEFAAATVGDGDEASYPEAVSSGKSSHRQTSYTKRGELTHLLWELTDTETKQQQYQYVSPFYETTVDGLSWPTTAWVRITQGMFAGEQGSAQFTRDGFAMVQLRTSLFTEMNTNGYLTPAERDWLSGCHDQVPCFMVSTSLVEPLIFEQRRNRQLPPAAATEAGSGGDGDGGGNGGGNGGGDGDGSPGSVVAVVKSDTSSSNDLRFKIVRKRQGSS